MIRPQDQEFLRQLEAKARRSEFSAMDPVAEELYELSEAMVQRIDERLRDEAVASDERERLMSARAAWHDEPLPRLRAYNATVTQAEAAIQARDQQRLDDVRAAAQEQLNEIGLFCRDRWIAGPGDEHLRGRTDG